MNEIALQIIEVGKLIGKKVFVKRFDSDNRKLYDENEAPQIFTEYDFEYYGYGILCGTIKLMNIEYKPKFGKYHLVTFKDL